MAETNLMSFEKRANSSMTPWQLVRKKTVKLAVEARNISLYFCNILVLKLYFLCGAMIKKHRVASKSSVQHVTGNDSYVKVFCNQAELFERDSCFCRTENTNMIARSIVCYGMIITAAHLGCFIEKFDFDLLAIYSDSAYK